MASATLRTIYARWMQKGRTVNKWKGITDKEAHALYAKYSAWDLIKAVEALLKEKNGG